MDAGVLANHRYSTGQRETGSVWLFPTICVTGHDRADCGGDCGRGIFSVGGSIGACAEPVPGNREVVFGGAYSIPIYPHLPFLTLVAVTVDAVTGLTLVVRHSGDVALLSPAFA